MGIGRWSWAMSCALASLGCSPEEGDVYINFPGPLIAEGGYAQIQLFDRYGATGCLDGSTDCVAGPSEVAITSQDISPTGIAEILPVPQRPAFLPPWRYTLHGIAPGRAEVCLEGRISSEKRRTACEQLETQRIERVQLDSYCGRVLQGWYYSFRVQMVGAAGPDRLLNGIVENPVDIEGDDESLAGLEDQTSGWGSYLDMRYQWHSPASGGALALSSRLDPEFHWNVSTYAGGSEISGIGFRPYGPGARACGEWVVSVGTYAVEVGGERACGMPPLDVTTETPEVCDYRGLGPLPTGEGQLEWQTLNGEANVTIHSSGTCRLRVAPTDAPERSFPVSFEVSCE